MTNRIEQYQLNNKFMMENREAITSAAPEGAVHFVVTHGAVTGYYTNWMEAFDAMGVSPGSIMGDI